MSLIAMECNNYWYARSSYWMDMMAIFAKVVTCLLVVAEALRIVELKWKLLASPQVVGRLIIITLHACTRSKVIDSIIVIVIVVVIIVVVISTKIAKSKKIGIWQSALCHQTVASHEKLPNHLERPMSTTNLAFSPATPINHPYQCHVLFPLRVLDLNIGKGCQAIKSISTSMHTINTTLHCCLPRARG